MQPPRIEAAGQPSSVFAKLYAESSYVDRYALDPAGAVDVIIPVMHTNELWRANLCSIYREIPVNRLIISDDGCVDDSIDIAREFPRVHVLDHRSFKSLGYSLRKLIEEVRTEWFVYLHSDVYLAPGWFEAMHREQSRFDWFESRQHTTVLADVPVVYDRRERPYSGAQMGRRAAFREVLPRIDDDFLYRNEDIILADLVKRAGFKYGRVEDALVHHQQMEKKSRWRRSIANVALYISKSAEEELREKRMQLYGLLKYLEPDAETFRLHCLIDYIYDLRMSGELDWDEFREWVNRVNPGWWPIIQAARNKRRILALAHRIKALIHQPAAAILRRLGI